MVVGKSGRACRYRDQATGGLSLSVGTAIVFTQRGLPAAPPPPFSLSACSQPLSAEQVAQRPDTMGRQAHLPDARTCKNKTRGEGCAIRPLFSLDERPLCPPLAEWRHDDRPTGYAGWVCLTTPWIGPREL
ncbi:hypothetical protein MTO96_023349 [Rhipicephalus appendiculatus]